LRSALAAGWPILVLLLLPRLAQAAAVLWARRLAAVLDRRIPDELPHTAGEWLRLRLAQLREPAQAIVTDLQGNAYRPGAELIQLRDTTYFKADPVHWASAAHELGHARVRRAAPWLGHLRTCAVALGGPLTAAGVGLAFGHLVYGVPDASAPALACLALALATRAPVLVDELAASAIALRELHRSDAIDFVHLRAARRVLAAFLGTYVVTYASYGLALAQWDGAVAAVAADRGPAGPAPAAGLHLALAAVLSALVVGGAGLRAVYALAPGAIAARTARSTALQLAASSWSSVAFVAVAWDRWPGEAYAWCAIAAVAASAPAWIALLDALPAIATRLVLVAAGPLAGGGVDATARYLRAREVGAGDVKRGNARLAQLIYDGVRRPPWQTRVGALAGLGTVPLALAYWIGG
jgi:Zn-dependent membrane protease YugP